MKSYSNDIVDFEQFKTENDKQTAEINKLQKTSKFQSLAILILSVTQIIVAFDLYFR